MSLEKVITESLGVAPDAIKDDALLRDIPSWDSMTHMVLITNLENHFGFQFTGDEIADIRSIADIRAIIDSRVVS